MLCGALPGIARAQTPGLQFTACASSYEVYNAPNIGDSVRAIFISRSGPDTQLTMELNDKVSAVLQVAQTSGKTFVSWRVFQPSSYMITTLTALAVSKHAVQFALFFHPVGGGASPDQMVLDNYAFSDGGPC